jgi:hypothetical protein
MDPDDIIDALTAEISKLNEHPIDEFSGDTLSRIGVRLASYKAGLGNYVSSAKADSWRAEKALAEAKSNGYKKLRAEGKTQGDAEQLRTLETTEEYEQWVIAKEREDRLVGLSYNISDLIDAIKSRLIHQQMELKENAFH